jgi:hypothetical protein
MADTRSMELVDIVDAAGMARLDPMPGSGSVAFVGRGHRPDWTCGACDALVLRRVHPGSFGAVATVVASGECGALNRVP